MTHLENFVDDKVVNTCKEVLKEDLNLSFDNKECTKGKHIINSELSIFDKHIDKFCTTYKDFDFFKENTISYIVLYIFNQEFNWTDQGYDILKKFYSQGVDSINEELKYILDLTSNR